MVVGGGGGCNGDGDDDGGGEAAQDSGKLFQQKLSTSSRFIFKDKMVLKVGAHGDAHVFISPAHDRVNTSNDEV